MRTYLSLLLLLLFVGSGRASAQQPFETFFRDSTLRLDYILTGGESTTEITPDEAHLLKGWAGRRHYLDSLVLRGNAQLYVHDEATGKLIYAFSFNPLYLEWRQTPLAKTERRSYEEVLRIPFPKAPVKVTLRLCNAEQRTIVDQTQRIDPKDILIRDQTTKQPQKHKYLIHSGDSRDCIDLAFLAEGYTEAEMPIFLRDAEAATEALFNYEPFKSNRQYFNVVVVFSPSEESGVAVPREKRWPRTAFSSHFDTFYSDRYLTTRSVKAINDALIGIPYEHLIILANSDVYGGGGMYNSYLISSTHHKWYLPVVVHEFGHSFGGLTDEYFHEGDAAAASEHATEVEPWEQNVTNLKDFSGKWSHLIKKGTPMPTPTKLQKKYPVGLYEGGAYLAKGMYRASYNCRMRTNDTPDFCPACRLGLDKILDYNLPPRRM